MNTIPINVDRNVSKRDYEHVPPGKLLTTSMFYTFQGEGPFAGLPAVFIRLAGCNIGLKQDCTWCDTRFNIDEGHLLSFEELMGYIRLHDKTKVIVFTGGEPLLQHAAICCFMDHVREMDTDLYCRLTWQVETNGLLLTERLITSSSSGQDIHYVVSPKIPHNMCKYPEVRKDWLGTDRLIYLKYVVTADPDSPYHEPPVHVGVLAHYHEVEVYVSGMCVYKKPPTGVASIWDTEVIDQKATAANYKHAAALALKHGFRVSYQTHLFGEQE